MCVYISTYLSIYIHFVFIRVCVCGSIDICMCLHIYICMYVYNICMHIFLKKKKMTLVHNIRHNAKTISFFFFFFRLVNLIPDFWTVTVYAGGWG